jgi:DNA-binding MarR family transcriptional regulator
MYDDAIVPIWILTYGLKPSEIRAYVALSSLCGLRSEHLVGIEAMAKMCRFSVSRTRGAIKSLDEKGLIVTKPSIRQDSIYCTVVYIDPTPNSSDGV